MDIVFSILYDFAMSKADYKELMLEQWKAEHPNHKCIFCEHRFVYAYEDDTPASYTPFHWWLGTCDATGQKIESDKLPPENCPFEKKKESFCSVSTVS